ADSSIVYRTHLFGSFAAAASSHGIAQTLPAEPRSVAADRRISVLGLVRFARFLRESMSGLMAWRALRSALARIASNRGSRLESPCSTNVRMAASRTDSSSLVTWESACSIEETTGGVATGSTASAAIAQLWTENRNNPIRLSVAAVRPSKIIIMVNRFSTRHTNDVDISSRQPHFTHRVGRATDLPSLP